MPDFWIYGVLHHDISDEEAERIAREGEPPELSPEDAKRLGEKMQQQAEVNAKLARDDLTLDDLFVEGDDEGGDLSDFEGREYDWEGAVRDLDEREAREREERET